jgi:hypothetical protein
MDGLRCIQVPAVACGAQILLDRYDPKKAYPAILAFGGGPQDMISVDNILNRNFRGEAEKRGYHVDRR